MTEEQKKIVLYFSRFQRICWMFMVALGTGWGVYVGMQIATTGISLTVMVVSIVMLAGLCATLYVSGRPDKE